jgi:hypothetical protein
LEAPATTAPAELAAQVLDLVLKIGPLLTDLHLTGWWTAVVATPR